MKILDRLRSRAASTDNEELVKRVDELNVRVTAIQIKLAVKAAEAVKLEAVKPSNRRNTNPWRPPEEWVK